jgi:hypothetical protein
MLKAQLCRILDGVLFPVILDENTTIIVIPKDLVYEVVRRLDSRVAFEVQQSRIVDVLLPYLRYEIAQWSIHGSITKTNEESVRLRSKEVLLAFPD